MKWNTHERIGAKNNSIWNSVKLDWDRVKSTMHNCAEYVRGSSSHYQLIYTIETVSYSLIHCTWYTCQMMMPTPSHLFDLSIRRHFAKISIFLHVCECIGVSETTRGNITTERFKATQTAICSKRAESIEKHWKLFSPFSIFV